MKNQKLSKKFESKHEALISTVSVVCVSLLALAAFAAAMVQGYGAQQALMAVQVLEEAARPLVLVNTQPLTPIRYQQLVDQVYTSENVKVSVLQGRGIEIRANALATRDDLRAFNQARNDIMQAERNADWTLELCAMKCAGGAAAVAVLKGQAVSITKGPP